LLKQDVVRVSLSAKPRAAESFVEFNHKEVEYVSTRTV
jgi:hypothetical protein